MRELTLCPLLGVSILLSGWPASWAAPAPATQPDGATLRQVRVVADKAPDCSTIETIARSVTRDCRTNDEKAVAIYNFLQLALYHRAYPQESGGTAALRALNVYGWSLCGGLHTIQAALWRELGWKWRYIGWPGHTTVEAFYDGDWHYLDVFLKCYFWRPDPKAPGGRTIASQADLAADPSLVLDGLVYDEGRGVYYARADAPRTVGGEFHWTARPFFVCTDKPEGVIGGVEKRSDRGSPTSWGAIKFENDGYNTDVNLSPGYALTLDWRAEPGAWYWPPDHKDMPMHGCPPRLDAVDRDYRNCPVIGPVLEPYIGSGGNKRTYASGTLLFEPDLSNDALLAGLADSNNVKVAGGKLVPAEPGKPASITVELACPYVMTRATGRAPGVDKAEISVDGGRTFEPVDLSDFSASVKGRYQALVKLTFTQPVGGLRLAATVQHNRCAVPYLSPGRNTITVTAANPASLGDNRLVVTYVYHTGSRSRTYEQIFGKGEWIAGAKYAEWSDTPTVVQKGFVAKDLPATFTIDVPTPKDKQPVYPRMVLLRREVVAPGEKPLPVPAGAVAPKVGSNDELKTLPSPFLMGSRVQAAAPTGQQAGAD